MASREDFQQVRGSCLQGNTVHTSSNVYQIHSSSGVHSILQHQGSAILSVPGGLGSVLPGQAGHPEWLLEGFLEGRACSRGNGCPQTGWLPGWVSAGQWGYRLLPGFGRPFPEDVLIRGFPMRAQQSARWPSDILVQCFAGLSQGWLARHVPGSGSDPVGSVVSATGNAMPVVMSTSEAVMPAVGIPSKHASSALPMPSVKEAATGIASVSAPEHPFMGTIPVTEYASLMVLGMPVAERPFMALAFGGTAIAVKQSFPTVVRMVFLITVIAAVPDGRPSIAVAILIALVARTVHPFVLAIRTALRIAHAAMPFWSANDAIMAYPFFCFRLSHPALWTIRVSGAVPGETIAVTWFLGWIRWPMPVTIVRALRWIAITAVPVIIAIVVVIAVVVITIIIIAVAAQHVIDILKDLDGIYDGTDSSSLGI